MRITDRGRVDVENDSMKRLPLNGTFELTARCNLQCKMCLIRIDHNRMKELGGRERTAYEWIRMAQEVREAGTISLLITGGEPMLHPDFAEIYAAIAQMGFMLTLYTNATLVTKEIYEVLKAYPPHRLGITVYGASADTYERVTNNAQGYEQMLEGVELLRKLPSILTIRTTIIKDNRKDLDRITGWALSLGKDVGFSLNRIVTKPVRGGIADVESCRLTPEENIHMIRQRVDELVIGPFERLVQEPDVIDPCNKKQGTPEEKSKRNDSAPKELYGCKAGIRDYAITWDGKLTGCQLLGDCFTYPFDVGFQAAWDDFPSHVMLPALPHKCRECTTTCSVCPATRLAETGTLEKIPEYLCRESKLAEELEGQIISDLQQILFRKGKERNECI